MAKGRIAEEERPGFMAKAYVVLADRETDVEKKKDLLVKASGSSPEDTGIAAKLAQMLREEGDIDGARDVLSKAKRFVEKAAAEAARKNDLEEKKRLETIARGIGSEIDGMDAIDKAINGIVDKKVEESIKSLPAGLSPGEREAKTRAMRRAFSAQMHTVIAAETVLKNYYRRAVGEPLRVTTEEVQRAREKAIGIQDETVLAANLKAEVLSKPYNRTRVMAYAKKLVSEGRPEEAVALIDAGGLTGADAAALKARASIVSWRDKVRSGTYTWSSDAEKAEAEAMKSILAPIQDLSLKAEVKKEYADYCMSKAGRLSGQEKKRVEEIRKEFYLSALADDPFLLGALIGAASLEGAEREVSQYVKDNILANKALSGSSDEYKNGLITLITDNIQKWEKAEISAQNMMENIGDIPALGAVKMLDQALRTGAKDIVKALLEARYRSPADQLLVLEAALKGLSMSPIDKIEGSGPVTIVIAPGKGNEALQGTAALVGSYFNMASGKFPEAAKGIKAAEEQGPYFSRDVELARLRLSIFQGNNFALPLSWWWSTRGFSAEVREAVLADRAAQLKKKAEELSLEDKIKDLKRAVALTPDNLDLHKFLKGLYDRSGNFRQALLQAAVIMEMMMERETYKDAAKFFDKEIKGREEYGKYEELQGVIDISKKAVELMPEEAPIVSPATGVTPPAQKGPSPGLRAIKVNIAGPVAEGKGEEKPAAGEKAFAFKIVIGVAGISDEDFATLEEKYKEQTDIQFVQIKKKSNKADMIKDMEKVQGPPSRFLVDMTDVAVKANMPQMVMQARRQAFVQMYPYLAGLDRNSIKKLNDAELADAFTRTLSGISESRMDMDGIMDALFEASRSGLQPASDVGLMPDVVPENAEAWVKTNVEAFNEYKKAREAGLAGTEEAQKLLALAARMNGYLSDKTPSDAGKILADHEMIAAIQNVEASLVKMFNALRERDLLPGAPQAVVIDARSKSESSIKQIAQAFIVCTKEAPLLRVCFIMPPGKKLTEIMGMALPANLSETTEVVTLMAADGEIVADIASSAAKHFDEEGVTIPLKAMSVVAEESPESVDGVISHVKALPESSANFVIVGREFFESPELSGRMNRFIPSLAVMSLLKRMESDKPTLMSVGCTRGTNENIRSNISELLNFIPITAMNIGKEIREMADAMIKAAVSL
jgi:hypothetical protein